MADKKHRSKSEEDTRFRSRPRKSFYKSRGFWVIVFFILLFGAIGTYVLMNKKEDKNLKQPAEKETDQVVEESEESAVENTENLESEKEDIAEPLYTYEDFKGTYVLFEDIPYDSPISGMSDIIVLREDSYRTFNRWDYDMTSTILSKTIEDYILTIDLDSDENEIWGRHSESGTEQFKLDYNGDRKILYSIKEDESFYSMSSEDLQTEYKQLEIDYARIIMTILGRPSLDYWAVWEDKLGTPIIDVSYHAAGDSIDISGKVTYPEKVTYLSFTDAEMITRTITYSTQGDGYIKVYPMLLPYNQDEQSTEENRKIAEQAINNAYTIYVEPFEPYDVADFIGHVEFVYQ